MATRKRSNKQKNIERWYNTYRNALQYYDIEVKELKKPSAKSLQRVKAQWQGIQKQKKKQGWTDLPTVYEASKFTKEHPVTQQPQETHNQIQFDIQYVLSTTDTLNSVRPRESAGWSPKSVAKYWREYESAKALLDREINHTIEILTTLQTHINDINNQLTSGQYDAITFNKLQDDYEHYHSLYERMMHDYKFNVILERIAEFANYYVYEATEAMNMQGGLIDEVTRINQNVQG